MSSTMTNAALWQSVNDNFSRELSKICTQAREDTDPYDHFAHWETSIWKATRDYRKGLTSHLSHPSVPTCVEPMQPILQYINSIPSRPETAGLADTLQKQALEAQTAAYTSQAAIQSYAQALKMESIAAQIEGTPSELTQAISEQTTEAKAAMDESLKALHEHGPVGSYLLCANLDREPGWLKGKSKTLGQALDPKYLD